MTESQFINRFIVAAKMEARLEDARAYVIRLLRGRFGEIIPSDVLYTIDAQPNVLLLEHWFDAAVKAASLEDFIAVLRR